MVTLISFILVMIGAINWLSVSIFQFDFVAGIFGSQANVVARIIYGLVGLAALILIYAAIKNQGYLELNGNMEQDEDLIGIDHDEREIK